MSATFVSPSEGWVLVGVSCGRAFCPQLQHTTDGGSTWMVLPSAQLASPAVAGQVRAVRFADPGRLALWLPAFATHDCGRSWQAVALPDLGRPLADMVTLAALDGFVDAVVPERPGQSKAPAGWAGWHADGAIGRPDELREQLFAKTLMVRTLVPLGDPVVVFAGLPAVNSWQSDGQAGYILAVSDPAVAAPAVTRALVVADADVLSISESRHSLEDVYLELVEKDEEASRR